MANADPKERLRDARNAARKAKTFVGADLTEASPDKDQPGVAHHA